MKSDLHHPLAASANGSATAAWPMGTPNPADEADDPRVVAALEEYVEAVEAGRRPDRREFLARFPEIRAALEDCLDGMALLRSVASHFGSSSGRPPRPAVADVTLPTQLGEYRLLREVGRGGMGVVYEAEQVSLGRRVALKVLPTAAALDPRQLQRFKVEAQAAAMLHHAHIVPVYTVGSDRGIHFYVMQFIEGRPVSEIIHELQRLRPPEAADHADDPRLAEDLIGGRRTPRPENPPRSPEAGHAPPPRSPTSDGKADGPRPGRGSAPSSSSRSRRHRSYYQAIARLGLQAAEALDHAHTLGVIHRDVKPGNLMVDGQGHTWITDFGLARLEGDASLTGTGDLLGTLRYMSPEQALGSRVADGRSDVYSLGATLCELLTLRPVFDGRDRPTLLRQIAEVEPMAPRKVDPSIPRDLETIVLKAMTKEPHGRYPTAQALADDLRRFHDDQPIQARRPNPIEGATRWARRHRPVVASAAAVLLLALVGLSVGTVLLWRENQRAIDNKVRAFAALNRACQFIGEDVRLFDPAREADARVYFREALKDYDILVQSCTDDPRSRWESARAFHNIGNIRRRLGEDAPAAQADAQAVTLLDALLAEDPRPRAYREELAHLLLYHTGDVDRALDLYAGLVAEDPEAPTLKLELGRCFHRRGNDAWKKGQLPAAQADLDRARRLLSEVVGTSAAAIKAREQLALVCYDLGELLRFGLMDGPAAEASYRDALRVTEDLLGTNPSDREAREIQAKASFSMCCPLIARPDLPEKRERIYRQAVDICDRLARDFPGVPNYREQAATARTVMASLLHGDHQYAEAAEMQAGVVGDYALLARQYPTVPKYRRALASAFPHYAHALNHDGRATEVASMLDRVADLLPEDAHSLNNFAWFLATSADSAPMADAPERAVSIAERAVAIEPGNYAFWNTLGVAQYRAGATLDARRSLHRSMQLNRGGDASDWFVMAILDALDANDRLARDWYDHASSWLEAWKPSPIQPPMNSPAYAPWAMKQEPYRDLLALQKEAATILGFPAAPRPAGPTQEGEPGPVEVVVLP